MSRQILLCAISNVQSGNCAEDCAFCAQSARYKTGIETFKFKEPAMVIEEAKKARAAGAIGFCLVTSGLGLDSKKTEYLSSLAAKIKKEVGGLFLIASAGIADKDALSALKSAGIDSYNHNLETSKEFYPSICTTHSWDKRYTTCENAKSAGLMLCAGGIFGLGESSEDRKSLLASLKSLSPMSAPLNFYHPNPALPIKENTLTVDDALNIIREAKKELEDTVIMVAGGREYVFKERQIEIFDAGCNAIIVGDYLTTCGQEPTSDYELLKKAGVTPLTECPFH
ncbi:MAG: biotin synthase [Campylobacteraceae bacterium]|jgi:biotin synthase|nr:biotin synthase [Campylobacteraceae bacterium]